MNRFFLIILTLVIALLAAGCNNTQARHSDGEQVTLTVEDKHRNLLGSDEDHTLWIVETDQGNFNPYYRAIGELDLMGRPKQYKDLKEGSTYTCRVAGQERAIVQQYRVIKDCQEI